MTLLVVGSVGLDKVETPYGTAEDELGGSAVYFSFAASHFCPVRLVGVVGRDFPAECLARIERRPIDTSGLAHVDGETFRWHGAYEGRMDQARTVDVQLNVLGSTQPRVPPAFADSRFVFLANGPPATQAAVLAQVTGPRFVMADTMNLWIHNERDGLLELMGRIDGIVMNDAEALQLSGEAHLLAAARWVCDRGPDYCVIKKGEHGALLRGPDGVFVLPGFPHEGVVDPTGAGDSFAGGMMGYLAQAGGLDPATMKRALAYGTITASFAIEEFGPRGLEELESADVEERLAEFVRRTHLDAGPQ